MNVAVSPLIDRHEAIRAIEAYLVTGSDKALECAVQAYAGHADLQSFAIMNGSGNGMTALERYLALAMRHGAISQAEAIRYVLSATGGGQL